MTTLMIDKLIPEVIQMAGLHLIILKMIMIIETLMLFNRREEGVKVEKIISELFRIRFIKIH